MLRHNTIVDAVQPSGKIQALGSDPTIRAGWKIYAKNAKRKQGESSLNLSDNHELTSIVKQWPGSISPGSWFSSLANTIICHVKAPGTNMATRRQ